jgi:hypothetical protein
MALNFDLIADYFPDTVPNDKVLDAYSRLQTWFAQKFPDLDTRPGSVFGDTFVLPAATYLAGKELGMQGFAADLDLESVAQGNIGRCDFVRMFLQNFGALDNKELVSSGILRLVFSVDAGFEINKGITFLYQDNTYQVRVFGDPALRVLPVGAARATSNDYVLTQTSSTRFFVDIPVESYSQGTVPSGTRFTSSIALPNNTEIQAVGDFFISAYTTSIPALARKTRETFHAASMGTKAGVIRTLKREFPDLTSVSPLIQGQPEMVRACSNQFGVVLPAVDVFVRSPFYGSTITQVVRLSYVDGRFMAPIEFTHVPLTITKVTLASSAVPIDHVLYTCSSDEVLYPGLSSAFSENALYWLKVPQSDIPIATAIDELGQAYQVFEITYTTEPYTSIVSRWLSMPENKPLGSNFQVRSFVPHDLSELRVQFRRDRGKKFDLSTAQTEVHNYMRGISYPTTYTDAEILDTMYYAGASMTRSISCVGRTRYSPATRYTSGAADLTLDEIEDQSVEIPTTYLSNTAQFLQLVVDEAEPQDNLYYAASDACTSFVLNLDNINLIEV